MQRNDQAEKNRVEIDGEEIPGLVRVGETSLEKGQIEVPGYDKIRPIQNGVSTVPAIEMEYKLTKGTNTLQFFRQWYRRNESHDVTKIRVDAAGEEFARTLYPDCECVRYAEPEYTADSPGYARVMVTLAPYDVNPIDAE